MQNILVCWVGNTDLRASRGELDGLGPIGQAVEQLPFDYISLISNYPADKSEEYLRWLQSRCSAQIALDTVSLSSPTNFEEIFQAVSKLVDPLATKKCKLHYHLSPGTPAMSAVWIILAKTQYPAALIESSVQQGTKYVDFPFDLAADFLPQHFSLVDKRLETLSAGLPPETPEFSDIIHRSEAMARVILKARKIALRSVPVLIEGESGTGKELFARAIHSGSTRNKKKIIPVNCGAIPAELVESELFGHEKGAFTGADKLKKGYFEEADGGTIFLDEIGELPLRAQVKLLRVLQEDEVVRVGSTTPVKIDVRIIAATNRNLLEESARGSFRSDLFYRLAVAMLKLPPLRDREGDLSLLIDTLMVQVNKESEEDPRYEHKKISASAKNIMTQHPWPGNIRELLNTLRRAAIWADGESINKEDIAEALIPIPFSKQSDILHRSIGESFNLQQILDTVAQHYLTRALNDSHGNKTQAAKMLGLSNYQTLTNWLKKYGMVE